jgi:hypothetical protein
VSGRGLLAFGETVQFDWSFIVGSGFVVAVLLLALVERLRHTFATKDDLNGLGQRVHALEDRYDQWQRLIEDTRESVRTLESEQRHQVDRVNRQVIDPLQRITTKLEEVAAAQISQAAAVRKVEHWLNNLALRIDREQSHAAMDRSTEP